MLINYLKIAFRNLFRHKFFTVINIFGLAFGLSISIIIGSWIWKAVNHDSFHENYDWIYRIYETQHYEGRDLFYTVATPGPLYTSLEEEYPEIEKATVVSLMYHKFPVRQGDTVLMERSMACVSPEFFEIFTYPLIEGDPATALREPNTTVITQSAAEKYFGDVNPMGKVLNINNKFDVRVVGIIEDMPDDAMYNIDLLFPFEFAKDLSNSTIDDWEYNSFQTYVLLKPDANPDALEEKITGQIKRHNEGSACMLHLMHIYRIDLYNLDGSEQKMQYIKAFGIIAIFIILIASINFMNLSTARSSLRAREVGLRKVAGARKAQLIAQFYTESYLTVIIALIVSMGLTSLFLFLFNMQPGFTLPSPFRNALFYPVIVVFTLIVGAISGIYPALALSSFKPVITLKGSRIKSGKSLLRKLLVVLQFTLSIGLIISTLVIYTQIRYLQNKDLGFDKENVIMIELPRGNADLISLVREKLADDPGILAVSAGSNNPSNIGSSTSNVDWDGKPPDETYLINIAFCDYDYFRCFGTKMVAGQELYPDQSEGNWQYIINESMAKLMRKENPVGERFGLWGMEGTVTGVCEDFIFNGFSCAVEPVVFLRITDYMGKVFVRLAPGDQLATIDRVEKVWNEISPDFPFDMRYFDEYLNYYFKSTVVIGQLFLVFTLLAVVISCLGLFGLASFMTMQRMKEIGIRKALGASIGNVIVLLGMDFIKWVIIGNVIAIPLAWLAMRSWLENFAYHTGLNPLIFIAASLMSLLIAVLTVLWQSVSVARMNPSETLKYE